MIAVVAGSYKQYLNFLHENKLNPKSYFYVSSFIEILGMRKVKYVLYGTYYENKDFDKIEKQLIQAEFERIYM